MSPRWNRELPSLLIFSGLIWSLTLVTAPMVTGASYIVAHLPAIPPTRDHHYTPNVSRTGAKGAPTVSTTTTAISTHGVSVPAPSGVGRTGGDDDIGRDGEVDSRETGPGWLPVVPRSGNGVRPPGAVGAAALGTMPERMSTTGTAATLPTCKSTEVLIHCRPTDCANKSCEIDICCPKPRALTGESASVGTGPRTYPPRCPGQMVRVVMTELGEWATCEEGEREWNVTSVRATAVVRELSTSTARSADAVGTVTIVTARRRPSLQPIPNDVTDITGRAVFTPDHPGMLAITVPHASGCVRIDWEDEVDQPSDCTAFGPATAEVSVPVPRTAGGSAYLRWNVLRWYVAVTYDTAGEEIGRRRQFYGHYVSARMEGMPIVPPVEGPKYRLLRALPIPANEALRAMGYVAGDRLYEFAEIGEWYVVAKGDAFGVGPGGVLKGAIQ